MQISCMTPFSSKLNDNEHIMSDYSAKHRYLAAIVYEWQKQFYSYGSSWCGSTVCVQKYTGKREGVHRFIHQNQTE